MPMDLPVWMETTVGKRTREGADSASTVRPRRGGGEASDDREKVRKELTVAGVEGDLKKVLVVLTTLALQHDGIIADLVGATFRTFLMPWESGVIKAVKAATTGYAEQVKKQDKKPKNSLQGTPCSEEIKQVIIKNLTKIQNLAKTQNFTKVKDIIKNKETTNGIKTIKEPIHSGSTNSQNTEIPVQKHINPINGEITILYIKYAGIISKLQEINELARDEGSSKEASLSSQCGSSFHAGRSMRGRHLNSQDLQWSEVQQINRLLHNAPRARGRRSLPTSQRKRLTRIAADRRTIFEHVKHFSVHNALHYAALNPIHYTDVAENQLPQFVQRFLSFGYKMVHTDKLISEKTSQRRH